MKTIKSIILIIAVAFIAYAQCLAHGIEASFTDGAKSIKFQYDDGTPMSFADITIITPEGKEFQSGLTDRNGNFSFIPDIKGEWKVVVDDGMGHRAEECLIIDEDYSVGGNKEIRFQKLYGIITGISLIFGLFGFFFMFGRRREK